ncbi:adenylate/guanylate cyclase domain-containing protein [Rhizobium sp. Root1240]|uniref:adenylate/guanylate cyclase domain-containing protein n=2 Tax=unclassified Rhizobium TaxID=2613769 RepID=UPI000AF48142|nr:adenylate/guanylate cyclase domain-containing protein [Rhizobium sp. Root1240]
MNPKPHGRPFLTEKAAMRLRIVTGLIMFTFVTMHFLNHALLLISEDLAEKALDSFRTIWRNPISAIFLYGSFTLHFLLALRTLYLRRLIGLRRATVVQVVFGLSLPLLIAQHVIWARLPVVFGGADTDYIGVIRAMWQNGLLGLKMTAAVIMAWVHGCLGLYATFSYRDWFPRYAQILFAMAIIVPTLALGGVLVTGQRLPPANTVGIEELARPPSEFHGTWLAATPDGDISAIERQFYIVLAGAAGVVLLLRTVRYFRHRESHILITYSHGALVHVPRGTSVLEASRVGHIDHYSVCGGKGRCSTCRVRVLESQGPLPAPNALEIATLARIKASPDTRLSCQLRPNFDLHVALQLEPPEGGDQFSSRTNLEVGREKDVLVMFADLRNFTSIAEGRLPYDIVFLLNSYFAILVPAIEAAGGRVDKYIGDGVMAIFEIDQNGPRDACRRAMGAAANIIAETQKLNSQLVQEFGIDLEVAIGIHYGPAILGMVGYGKVASLTAIGDTVNVASRLETAAKQFNVALAVSEAVMLLAELPREGVTTRRLPLRGRRLEMTVLLFSPEQAQRYL